MKKLVLIVFAVLLLLMEGCAAAGQTGQPPLSETAAVADVPEESPAPAENAPLPAEEEDGGQALFLIATDLHYMAPELTDHDASFQLLMENGDGKVTEYCEEIVDAFLAEAAEKKPEALILTGDLSFNGARASHLALADKLGALEASGVPVFVLPGNHDVYRSTCAAYFGDGYESVPGVTGDEFAEIYADFGFDEALSRDASSLSYVARVNDQTWLLMLDANTIHDYCSLSKKTFLWAEEQLKAAREEGITVLAACHQNLFQHSMFKAGYMLNCSDDLFALLEKYGVRLFLSGHMHIQHILTRGSVTEIAGSALTMGACQYGVLRFGAESASYEAVSVDLSGWAETRGVKNEDLLDFPAYALNVLDARTRTQARAQLEKTEIPDDERDAMAEYACALNLGYFIGDLTVIPSLDPDGTLQKRWEEAGVFFSSYFASIRPDIGKDFRKWEMTF